MTDTQIPFQGIQSVDSTPTAGSTTTPTPTSTLSLNSMQAQEEVNNTLHNGWVSVSEPTALSTSTVPSAAPTSLPTDEPKLPTYAAAISDAVDLADAPLFSQSLISPEVQADLPNGYSIRPLRRSDYQGGMISLPLPVVYNRCRITRCCADAWTGSAG